MNATTNDYPFDFLEVPITRRAILRYANGQELIVDISRIPDEPELKVIVHIGAVFMLTEPNVYQQVLEVLFTGAKPPPYNPPRRH